MGKAELAWSSLDPDVGWSRCFHPAWEQERYQRGATLTLEPGGPTRPAAPGNPVAPYGKRGEPLNDSGTQVSRESNW
jgi:hypothetical protein